MAYVVTDNLVVYYNSKQGFDSGSKVWENLAPETQGYYNCTVNEDVYLTSDGMYIGDQYEHSYIHMGEISLIPRPSPTTIEIRVKLDNYSAAEVLQSETTTGSAGDDGAIWVTNNGEDWESPNGTHLEVYFAYTGENPKMFSVEYEFIKDTEYYLTVTYNPVNGDYTVFINGQKFTGTTYTNCSILGEQTSIPGFFGTRPQGIMDNIRIYSKTLSDAEALQNYSVGREVALPPQIVTDGLLGYYNSNQGVTNVWENLAPMYKGQNNALITAGTVITSEGLYFDGVDDEVNIPIPTELDTVTSATLEFRIQNIENVDVYPVIFSENGMYSLFVSPDGSIGNRLFTDHDDEYWYSTGIDFSNTETYISVVADHTQNRVSIYANGQLTNSIDVTVARIVPSFPLLTVSYSYGGDSGRGIIDNIRLYNRVLTPQEIENNIHVGRQIGLPEPKELQGEAKLMGKGNLRVIPTINKIATSDLRGEGKLKVEGSAAKTAKSSLIGKSTGNVKGTTLREGKVSIKGEGLLSVTATAQGTIVGSSKLVCKGKLATLGRVQISSSSSLKGEGKGTVRGVIVVHATTELRGNGILEAKYREASIFLGSATLKGRGILDTIGEREDGNGIMAISTLNSHIYTAINLQSQINTAYLVFGKTTPWTDEKNPPNEDENITELSEIVGYKKVKQFSLARPLKQGENPNTVGYPIVTYNMQDWVLIPTDMAYTEQARWK